MSLITTGFNGAIATNYIPALNKVDASKGLKILMLAHTVMEGFSPTTVAFKTNNPGNIGTDTSQGRVRSYPTLAEGVAAQLRLKEIILEGKSKYYKPTDGLLKYLSTYAPPPQNNPANYLKLVQSVFKKQGYDVTATTTLQEIAAIGVNDEKKKFYRPKNGWFSSGDSVFGGFHFFLFGK